MIERFALPQPLALWFQQSDSSLPDHSAGWYEFMQERDTLS